MDFILELLETVGSGISTFVGSIVQAVVPNVEALIYQGTWSEGVWTKAAEGGYTAVFGFVVLGITLGLGYGIFRLVRRIVGR